MKRSALLVCLAITAGCSSSVEVIVSETGTDDLTTTANAETPASTSTTELPVTTTTLAPPEPSVDPTYPLDRIPGLGRSPAASDRDMFLATYQAYQREVVLHRCMAENEVAYAPYFSGLFPMTALLRAAPTATDLEPVQTDLERMQIEGPVLLASDGSVQRFNMSPVDAGKWNDDEAKRIGDEWWLARYGITAAEAAASGEAGFGQSGCEANYWGAIPSVWDLRRAVQSVVDDDTGPDSPQAAKDASFERCREEFGFAEEDLGELEGSGSPFFEVCLERWDAAGQLALQSQSQEDLALAIEDRFASEIQDQRDQLQAAESDRVFLAFALALG